MKIWASIAFSFLAFGTLRGSTEVMAQDVTKPEPVVLERMGVMFVGGRQVEMPGGGRVGGGAKQTQIAGQAPVHFLIPPEDKREGKRPIIMIPGMGLTSYLYLSTPDGRDGWAQLFAKAGYPVYVFDEPNNAISGFEVGKFTGSAQSPRILLWSNEITWRRWGIGPEPGVPAENTRFPVKYIDQLHASMTPVMGGGRGVGRGGRGRAGGGRFGRGRGQPSNEESATGEQRGRGFRPAGAVVNPKVEALVKLLEKVGPATLILHSASGPTGFEAARQKPDLVKAIVAVEVTGSPTNSDDINRYFAKTQLIGIYGDNFNLRPMAGRLEATQKMSDMIKAAGGKGEVIWLPKEGINGNSHLLMQDNNNDAIANMIIERLAK
jgi:pimeloyl-ACP methyl ester carboxylesterase